MNFAGRLIIVIAIAAACAAPSLAQVKPAKADQLRVLNMNNISFPELLAQLAADYQVTVSLEINSARPPVPVTIDLRDVNFTQIFDGLIRAEPGYQCRERDGGIEVYPLEGASDLLDTPIQQFKAEGINYEIAIWNLLASPEVQAYGLSRGLKPLRAPQPAGQIKSEKVTLNLSGVTLRQTLNKIAGESGVNFWMFRRCSNGSFEIITRP